MPADPRVLDPDHLPTPFSADEIRVGCPPGRTIRVRVFELGQPPYVGVTKFVSGDAAGAEQESWRETPNGERLTEPRLVRSTWLELQGHASMPRATTTIDEETVDLPAGRYDCLRYTRREGDEETSFWFARSAPGMPLKLEERVKGELVYASEAIEDRRPG
jgi:hypothetical protein